MWFFLYFMLFILSRLTLTQEDITLTQKNTDIKIIGGIYVEILKYLYNIMLILLNMIIQVKYWINKKL